MPRDARARTVRTWLIDPGVAIPAEAAAIHGITTEHARDARRPPREALEEIAADLADALRDGVPVVAYNAVVRPVACSTPSCGGTASRPSPDRLGRAARAGDRPAGARPRGGPLRQGKRKLGDLCGCYQRGRVRRTCTPPTWTSSPRSTCSSAIVGRFPHLATLDLDTLHEYQSTAHQAWAESFNAWRAEQGFDGPGASDVWPAREPVGTLW